MEQTGRGRGQEKERSTQLYCGWAPTLNTLAFTFKHDTICRKQQDREQTNYTRQLSGSNKQGRGIPKIANQ